jgi:predicted permease
MTMVPHEPQEPPQRSRRSQWPSDARRAVDEEVRLHIELRVEQLVAEGMERARAEAEARRRFASLPATVDDLYESAQERDRRAWWRDRWGGALQDWHHAWRSVVRAPAVPALVVLILALGIGANVTIFSAAYGILERPLPVPDAHRLARVYRGAHSPVAYRDFLRLADATQAFQALTAERMIRVGMSDGERTEPVEASLVSANYFVGLGIDAQAGRVFVGAAGTEVGALVVLSDRYWRTRFAADRDVLGRTLRLGDRPFTVIGVTPASWASSGFRPDVYVPLSEHAGLLGVGAGEWNGSVYVTGRLVDGRTREQANEETLALAISLFDAAQTATEGGPDAYRVTHARGITEEVRGAATLASVFLLAVVALVLLTACANVANLLLARTTFRARDLAIRLALGVSRSRLLHQLMAESVLLALVAGAAAVVVAVVVTHFLETLLPADVPIQLSLTPDIAVLAYTAALSLVTGFLFGLAPALHSIRTDLQSVLREDASRGGEHRSRLRSAFLVAQVSMSTVLLTGAALFARSLHNAQELDPGFDTEGVVDMAVDVSLRSYDEERGRAFFAQLIDVLETSPGVHSVALANLVPLSGSNRAAPVQPATADPSDPAAFRQAYYNTVSRGYFATLRLPLRAGRDFTDDDRAGALPVTIINETAARMLWPDQPVVGNVLRVWDDGMPEFTVVGVAADAKYNSLGEGPVVFLYFPFAQDYRADMVVHARVGAGAASAVRDAVAKLDPAVPLPAPRPIEADMAFALAGARIGAGLLGWFGALAVLLAAIGIYGVTAYMVARRTVEVGIRCALGASRYDVLRLIVGDTLRVVALGLVLGLAGGVAFGRVVASQLYGVSALDAPTFLLVPPLLLGIAMVAALVPAAQAVALDPVTALRRD